MPLERQSFLTLAGNWLLAVGELKTENGQHPLRKPLPRSLVDLLGRFEDVAL